MTTIAERIRLSRKSAGFTQKDVAIDLNCSESAVRMWELGKNEPSIETIESLADLFSTTPEYLTGWTDDPINYEDGDIIASIPLSYMEACDYDVKKAYRLMQTIHEEGLAESRGKHVSEEKAELTGFENPIIRNIARAASEKKLTVENLEHLEKYAKMMWPEAFEDE